MSTIVYNVKYRPVRVGWCVREGDREALIKAFRLNHCLWGGRFNPVIIVDDEARARHFIELFHVDSLFPVSKDEQTRKFSTSLKHLPWPGFHQRLFDEYGERKECTLLDIYHPLGMFYEQRVKNNSPPETSAIMYNWSDDDPCAGVFEAMLGGYPDVSESGIDYKAFATESTGGQESSIAADQPLDIRMLRAVTPNVLTTLELRQQFGFEHHGPGIFWGDARSFSHLVEFWNLRAANIDLLFFDPAFTQRFAPLAAELERFINSSPPHQQWGPQSLTLWLKRGLSEAERQQFKVPLTLREVKESTWDDSSWEGLKVDPPVVYFAQRETVAQISETERQPIVTIQLGQKPGFAEGDHASQNLVVSLKSTLNFSEDDRFTYKVPYIPELNEHFGRKHHFQYDAARAERDGVGIITDLGTEYVNLRGMERVELAKAFFKAFGIEAEASQPGLICGQLIRQMGGVQGCRVFKISGVRKLIQQFGPTQTFVRSYAIKTIGGGDPVTGRPNFDAYKDLHIEPREKDSLNPEDAFSYLLRRGVFRAGLNLKCPSCQLTFWRSLDDAKTLLDCEYCGQRFNVAPQLKGENWAYRPSGLFGRDDHQEGGVPVALTLQQLHTSLHSDLIFWLPAMLLHPISAPITECETDLVMLHQGKKGQPELLIGECKTNKEITNDDVRNLAQVADALTQHHIDVFILFAKAGRFSADEIQRCRAADSNSRQRTILLSDRELEPYFTYELAKEDFAMSGSPYSFQGMVQATHDIYFEPRPVRRA